MDGLSLFMLIYVILFSLYHYSIVLHDFPNMLDNQIRHDMNLKVKKYTLSNKKITHFVRAELVAAFPEFEE